MYGMGCEFFRQKLEVFDAVIICASFALDLVFLNGIGGAQGEEAAALLIVFLLWRLLRVINGLMVTEKKRQEFRLKLQKRARRKAEKRVEVLEEDKRLKDKELEAIKELCKHKGASDLEISNCKPRRLKSLFNKMDTSAGLSSIAALSLGFGMSMSSSRVMHSPGVSRSPYKSPSSKNSPGEIQLHNIMVGVGLLNDAGGSPTSSTTSKSPKHFLSVPKYKKRYSPTTSPKSTPSLTPKKIHFSYSESADGSEGAITPPISTCRSTPNVNCDSQSPNHKQTLLHAQSTPSPSDENMMFTQKNGDIGKNTTKDTRFFLPDSSNAQVIDAASSELNSNQNNSVNIAENIIVICNDINSITQSNQIQSLKENNISLNNERSLNLKDEVFHNNNNHHHSTKIHIKHDQTEPPSSSSSNLVTCDKGSHDCEDEGVRSSSRFPVLYTETSTLQHTSEAEDVNIKDSNHHSSNVKSTQGQNENERLTHSSTSSNESNESTDSRGNPISEPCRAKRALFATKSQPIGKSNNLHTQQNKIPLITTKQALSFDMGDSDFNTREGEQGLRYKQLYELQSKSKTYINGRVGKGDRDRNSGQSPSDPELYAGQDRNLLVTEKMKDDISL